MAVAIPVKDEELGRLGYRIFFEAGKKVIRTREGVKVDIYSRDVSGMPVPKILETAVTKQVGNERIQVMCLEVLLIAKMRASRPQNISDAQHLCQIKGRSIRWEVVESMATPVEVSNPKTTVLALSS
ncbi:MAG: nucleotidyltransferase [Thaumarchaeota archaeon]|nr:nucleotidyltransferase [Nitrososphaerota archaeon]